jgi:hypothetical protein
MANNVQTSASGGIGIGTLTWIVLIVLKATGTIAMSWFWVLTSIVWVPIIIFFAILVFVLLLGVISAALS